MNGTRCPGGDHTKGPDDLCCDACWDRLPDKIEGEPWKRGRHNARRHRQWQSFERYNERLRRWLAGNPLEVSARG